MSRIVCVSNRIALPRRAAAPGGLAVGVLAALRERGGVWFGWSGETSEDTSVSSFERDGVTYATTDLTPEQYDRHYKGFCNTTLWPLFHYLTDHFRFDDSWHSGYLAVNRAFAERLASRLAPGDLIWIHDYHLVPMARMLRELGVANPIGFFLHIPFPHIEVLRLLPTGAEIIRDLAAYDVVGFQTDADARSFASGVESVFGDDAQIDGAVMRIGERDIAYGSFPIGVDVDGVVREASGAQGTEPVRRMIAGLLGRRLMIGVDRLDYSKGLVERFVAYQRFLERHSEHRGALTYLQIAPLSRDDIHAYAEIRRALEQATGRTNGRFADTDWTPIRYLNRNFPHATLMGFLRAAQVGLVTPLRDGMNLVAKEFVAAQDPSDPGALVLSSLAGAANELVGAVIVNPYDLQGVANAIESALSMPLAERRERHAQMMEVLRRQDIHAWHRGFIDVLEEAA